MKICKNCGGKLVERAIKRTAEQLEKPYYYTAYYWCPNCKRLYHDEKFKVINEHVGGSTWHVEGDYKPQATSHEPEVEIWTDGACVNNGKKNARAAWAFVSGKTEKAGLVVGKQTNNVAEGLAIYHALVWAAEKGYKKIKLHTDSQISLHGVSKHHSKVKVNREIFENIANVIDENYLQIEYIKVLGHSGEPNNERVDKLANNLARKG